MASAQLLSKEFHNPEISDEAIDAIFDLRSQIDEQREIGETGGPVRIDLIEPVLLAAGVRVQESDDTDKRNFIKMTNMFVQSERRHGQEVVFLPHEITESVLRSVGAGLLRSVELKPIKIA